MDDIRTYELALQGCDRLAEQGVAAAFSRRPMSSRPIAGRVRRASRTAPRRLIAGMGRDAIDGCDDLEASPGGVRRQPAAGRPAPTDRSLGARNGPSREDRGAQSGQSQTAAQGRPSTGGHGLGAPEFEQKLNEQTPRKERRERSPARRNQNGSTARYPWSTTRRTSSGKSSRSNGNGKKFAAGRSAER